MFIYSITFLKNKKLKDPTVKENVSVNENPPANNEEIEEEVKVEDVGEVREEKVMQDEATGIPPIDTVLAQQIMSFLKGLYGQGMLPSTQVPTNPPVGRNVPQMVEVGGNDAFSSFVGFCDVQ